MNQQFLKEIEKGTKSALVKKRIITHYKWKLHYPRPLERAGFERTDRHQIHWRNV